MNDIVSGALIGAVAGLAAGLLGEWATGLVASMFPTDVGIAGYALVWGVTLGGVVGAVAGWRGWLLDWRKRAIAAAVPGMLAGAGQAFMQWEAAGGWDVVMAITAGA